MQYALKYLCQWRNTVCLSFVFSPWWSPVWYLYTCIKKQCVVFHWSLITYCWAQFRLLCQETVFHWSVASCCWAQLKLHSLSFTRLWLGTFEHSSNYTVQKQCRSLTGHQCRVLWYFGHVQRSLLLVGGQLIGSGLPRGSRIVSYVHRWGVSKDLSLRGYQVQKGGLKSLQGMLCLIMVFVHGWMIFSAQCSLSHWSVFVHG